MDRHSRSFYNEPADYLHLYVMVIPSIRLTSEITDENDPPLDRNWRKQFLGNLQNTAQKPTWNSVNRGDLKSRFFFPDGVSIDITVHVAESLYLASSCRLHKFKLTWSPLLSFTAKKASSCNLNSHLLCTPPPKKPTDHLNSFEDNYDDDRHDLLTLFDSGEGGGSPKGWRGRRERYSSN